MIGQFLFTYFHAKNVQMLYALKMSVERCRNFSG